MPRQRVTWMVLGVAVIGAVAAIVACAMALRVARLEEQALEAEVGFLEQRLEVRLARVEAQLVRLNAHLTGPEDRNGRGAENHA